METWKKKGATTDYSCTLIRWLCIMYSVFEPETVTMTPLNIKCPIAKTFLRPIVPHKIKGRIKAVSRLLILRFYKLYQHFVSYTNNKMNLFTAICWTYRFMPLCAVLIFRKLARIVCFYCSQRPTEWWVCQAINQHYLPLSVHWPAAS